MEEFTCQSPTQASLAEGAVCVADSQPVSAGILVG